MECQKIYDDGEHSWLVFARDPHKPDEVIDTNEFAIISNGEVMLLDPGGTEIFPQVLSSVSKEIELENITKFLCSHQDPDIMSSLPLWLALCPDAKVYLSWVWNGFVAHFGKECVKNFDLVPDKDIEIKIGKDNVLKIVVAHYCHSSGNLNLYDPRSEIMFTGDMGAAILPKQSSIFVENFQDHIKYMENFHVRWMPSNTAKNRWVKKVRSLNPKILCPQHGSLFKGEMVGQFLDWLEDLDVGRY